MNALHIGTCSWKYPSWKGLIYSRAKPKNFLQEYSGHFDCVEVDQWFWSLFGDKVVLPKAEVVREYATAVPDGFRFGVKVPNSLTLTHHPRRQGRGPLLPNPHFLSSDLLERFLDSLAPLQPFLGPLMFQFEYLNQHKMSGQAEFLDRFGEFARRLPGGFAYMLETRNPNYLNETYFRFLLSLGFGHVFLQGYYMPDIFEVFSRCEKLLGERTVIRLHGPSRQDIEVLTGNAWGEIVDPRDNELDQMVAMLAQMQGEVFVFVNNHFEGSAPRTIARIRERLAGSDWS